MSPQPIRNVTLVGARGNLGSVLLNHLLSAGFTVTILVRQSSTSSPPPNVSSIRIPDTWPVESLVPALLSSDAVIACWPLKDVSAHLRLAIAAAAAGVRRFIPADFGSVDSRSPRSQEVVPLFGKKTQVRELLQQLSEKSERRFTWTSLVNGHFFDWGLKTGFLHVYPEEKKVCVLGSGKERSSLSTLDRVAEAVVRVLKGEPAGLERTANRTLMVQSFCVSQREVHTAIERVRKEERWEIVEEGPIQEYIDKRKAVADAGGPDSGEAIEDLVYALGVEDGDWTKKGDYAMELLGLEDEDIEDVLRRVLI